MKQIIINTLIAALSVSCTLYVTVWQDEELTFKLSEPSTFGNITYQNLIVKTSAP